MRTIRYQRLLKKSKLGRIGNDLLGLFYPRICVECGGHLLPEFKVLCPMCVAELPRCRFSGIQGNRVEEMFYGRIRIEAASSYLFFKKDGMVQRLMHLLKYKGRQDIGEWLGEVHSAEIAKNENFNSIDLVIPVPLHPKKKRKRGYNQVSGYGQILADRLEVPFEQKLLIRNQMAQSLTQKNRLERNESMSDAFLTLNETSVKFKHILLVDDIITSGATLTACARQILKQPGTRVSLASMAFTL